MDAGTLLYSLLSQSPAVQALCGGRVFHVRVPQGQAMPAVVYQLISQIPQQYILNQRSYDLARVQISIFADSYPTIAPLAAAVRAVLDGYRQDDIISMVLDLETDHFEDGADRYHRTQDYRLNLPAPGVTPPAPVAPPIISNLSVTVPPIISNLSVTAP